MTTKPERFPDRSPSVPRPDGALQLRDATGTELGWTVVDRDGEPVRAEPLVRMPGVDAARFARIAAADLGGMRVATDDEELAHALIEVGGSLVRRATVMATHPKPSARTVPAAPQRYDIVSFDLLQTTPEALAEPLTGPRLAAYHPAHPDHDPAADHATTRAELVALLSGAVLGPVEPSLSAVVRAAGDRATLGAIIVTCPPEDGIWPGGPWIADLFVHPRHAGNGLGRHLLGHTLSACARLSMPRLGLAVTQANTAADLYHSAGFTDLFSSWAIHLPSPPSRSGRRSDKPV